MRPLVRHIPAQAKEAPPPPRGPERFVGHYVMFNLSATQRVKGYVVAARDNGVRGPGAIPDYMLDVRGQSGRVVTVSVFDTYATFTD